MSSTGMASVGRVSPHLDLSNGLISAAEAASLAKEDVVSQLHSASCGLSHDEAKARINRFGANVLPRPIRTPWLVQLVKNFIHLFAVLLWIGALLAWLAGMPQLGVAIVIVVLINGIFSYGQQYRAQQAVDALEQLLPRQVKVRRDSIEQTVTSTDIAVGDIVLLEEGDSIPADLRLLSAVRFRVDNSALTGESRPVTRQTEPMGEGTNAVADLRNTVFAGTVVASGRAEGIAIATGRKTEFGRLAQLTHVQPPQVSTLERELARITRLITILALGMGALFFVLGAGLAKLSWTEGFMFSLGIIVANVPEGLLPTLSLALAMGMRRMAARNAIVKRLERVETLGAVTVIVTDKTGTLTENQMTVREIWQPAARFSVDGQGYKPVGKIDCIQGTADDLAPLLLMAALCCDAQLRPCPDHDDWTIVGDPTEGAILTVARKAGITPEQLQRYPRVAELPFDSVRKRMTTLQVDGEGTCSCTKGAVDEVLPRCTTYVCRQKPALLTNDERERIASATAAMASRGLRVLAIAARSFDSPPAEFDLVESRIETGLTFLGLVGMEDPPRPEVAPAIQACTRAGIRIIMATGDDGHTAAAIGREIGLCQETTRMCSGSQLAGLSSAELALLLGDQRVHFSRVAPEHKLRIVEALQKRGEVVAVTGDGVNDAPALKRADIGVAMGRSGTDVARQAADMILIDDNFASIVAAVEEGRAVYDNVKKFVTYIFASNIPEIVPFIAFVLCRIPLPLTVMQILAVDLGTDLLPALALGAESPEPQVMRRPPRQRSQRLLDASTLLRAYAWLGMIEAVLCLFGFFAVYWLAGWRPGMPLASAGLLYVTATTMSLAGIVACQVGNGLVCRSSHESVFRLGLLSNPLLIAGIGIELALLAALIYISPLAALFQLAPLSPIHWVILATFGAALLLAEETRKWLVRRSRRRTDFDNAESKTNIELVQRSLNGSEKHSAP